MRQIRNGATAPRFFCFFSTCCRQKIVTQTPEAANVGPPILAIWRSLPRKTRDNDCHPAKISVCFETEILIFRGFSAAPSFFCQMTHFPACGKQKL
jgi:hypothetical protein